MTTFQAAVLGVVQGLTEFLPVSSSGHLILVPRLLGWADQGLTFDAAIHLGTLAALLVYFREEIVQMLLEKTVESTLRGPRVVALSLIAWGLVMWIVDRRAAARRNSVTREQDVTWRQGMFVGVAQALALVPGTSRSGITITAGLLGGLDRPTAARFAFLLGIPITAAAGGHKMLSILRHGAEAVALGPLAVGIVTSFVAGLAAVWFLVNLLKRRSLLPFVVYRCALGLVILEVLR